MSRSQMQVQLNTAKLEAIEAEFRSFERGDVPSDYFAKNMNRILAWRLEPNNPAAVINHDPFHLQETKIG